MDLLKRNIIGASLLLTLGLTPLKISARSSVSVKNQEDSTFLKIYVKRTGLRANLEIKRGGKFLKDGLKNLLIATSDTRENKFKAMDPELIMILMRISETLMNNNMNNELTIYSGFRSIKTNVKVGGKKNSLHLQNKAIDISVEGVPESTLKKIAISSGAKGVGLYNGFIHIDTGLINQKESVREW